MTANIKYECQQCGSIKELPVETKPVPECCGRPMLKEEPLDACETSFSSEDTRIDTPGEPCDDGRSGKI